MKDNIYIYKSKKRELEVKSGHVLWKFAGQALVRVPDRTLDRWGWWKVEHRFPARFRVNPARSPEYRVQPAGPISLDVYQRRPASLNSSGERENADGLFINQSGFVGDDRDWNSVVPAGKSVNESIKSVRLLAVWQWSRSIEFDDCSSLFLINWKFIVWSGFKEIEGGNVIEWLLVIKGQVIQNYLSFFPCFI